MVAIIQHRTWTNGKDRNQLSSLQSLPMQLCALEMHISISRNLMKFVDLMRIHRSGSEPGVFKRSFPQAYPRVFDSGIYPNARCFAFLKLYATRIIPLTEERLNSPQPGIIWTYPYPVIYDKKYAGLIFFNVFYCSLSP